MIRPEIKMVRVSTKAVKFFLYQQNTDETHALAATKRITLSALRVWVAPFGT
jgi:hypothetical protein